MEGIMSIPEINSVNSENEDSKSIPEEFMNTEEKVWNMADFSGNSNEIVNQDSSSSSMNDKSECDFEPSDDAADTRELEFSTEGFGKSIKNEDLDRIMKEFPQDMLAEANGSSQDSDLENMREYRNDVPVKVHKCHWCDYGETLNLLEVRNDIQQKENPHKCNLCYYSAFRWSLPARLDCHLCDFSTTIFDRLKMHRENIHSLMDHKCDLCDDCTGRTDRLKRHVDTVHLKIKPHKRDLCDESPTRKSYLQGHINVPHLQVKPLKCNFCNYTTTDKSILTKHTDIHKINSICESLSQLYKYP